jgi:quinol monooxygenase YgiN
MPVIMTARFEVQAEQRAVCEQAIREFVHYVHTNEPDTLLYTSVQEAENPNRFLHYFIFKDEAARDRHAGSAAVDRFTGALYPSLVEPVEFTEYNLFATTA